MSGTMPLHGTTYYYRVRTSNEGGTSTWANGSFHTVAPMLALAAPNGMEGWRRGLKYFVQWQGNTPEPVVIDLYKGGVFLMELTPECPQYRRLSVDDSSYPGARQRLFHQGEKLQRAGAVCVECRGFRHRCAVYQPGIIDPAV